MESEEKKPINPSAFPMTTAQGESFQTGMTLRDYAQIKFMSAIISNADTMREITKTWNNIPSSKRIDFEELVAKVGGSYADAMLKQREL